MIVSAGLVLLFSAAVTEGLPAAMPAVKRPLELTVQPDDVPHAGVHVAKFVIFVVVLFDQVAVAVSCNV